LESLRSFSRLLAWIINLVDVMVGQDPAPIEDVSAIFLFQAAFSTECGEIIDKSRIL
jgi:hypothetical protein